MYYIALLRGINVGGNNKIGMKELRRTFEQAGMEKVTTYIQSGNVVFRSTKLNKESLPERLHEAIRADFGLDIPVLVRTLEEIGQIVEALPDSWTNDSSMKADVMFLWSEADHEGVLEQLPIKAGIDRVSYVPGAVLWSLDRKDASKSSMSKLIGTKLYRQMTVRNVNTVRNIWDLMQAATEDR